MLGVLADGATDCRPLADDDRYVRNALRDVNRYDGDVFVKTVPAVQALHLRRAGQRPRRQPDPERSSSSTATSRAACSPATSTASRSTRRSPTPAPTRSPRASRTPTCATSTRSAAATRRASTAGRTRRSAARRPLAASYLRFAKIAPQLRRARSPRSRRRRSTAASRSAGWRCSDQEATRDQGAGQGASRPAQGRRPQGRRDRLRRRRPQARPRLRRGRPHRLRGQPPVVDSALVDRERFTEHLAAPIGRGVVLSGGFDGAAGGALCGDLIRVSVRVAGDRVVEAALRRLGLRRADRRGLGGGDAGRGRVAARRRARGRVGDRRGAGRALAGQAARRGSGRGRAAPGAGGGGARVRCGAGRSGPRRWSR